MVRFVKKLCLFAALFCVLLLALFWLSGRPRFRLWFAKITGSVEYVAGEGEAEAYIRKVSAEASPEAPCTTLILGDSVCNQMFNSLQEGNPSICIDGNNRGMTLAGEYLLLDEFLRHQDGVTDVWLIVGPNMLQSDIDVLYGYQYVVIPFARYDMLDRLEPETTAYMKDLYGSLFLNKTVASMIGDSNVGRKLYLNYLKEKYAVKKAGESGESGRYPLSMTARIYLPKIAELCGEHQITLHLLATPQADNEYRRDEADELLQYVEETEPEYADLFADYFDTLVFYPEEQFADGIHFGGEYDCQGHFNDLIEEMYQEQGYLRDLVLSE